MSRKWLRSRRRTAAALAAVLVASGAGLYGLQTADRSKDSAASPARNHVEQAHTSTTLGEAEAGSRARKTGKRVEATALRTARTTTYALPDGQMQLEAHAAPIRAWAGGRWQAIDTTLVRAPGGGWQPKAVNNQVVFSAGGRSNGSAADRGLQRRSVLTLSQADASPGPGTPLVTLTSVGHDLTLTWPGSIPAPTVEGPRALYPDILPGVDLVLTARDSGFSQVLVVKTREAAQNPALAGVSYGLSSPDLKFTMDHGTDVVRAKDAQGNTVAVAPTPFMWDSAGTPAIGVGDASAPPPTPEDPPSGSASPDPEESDDPAQGPADNQDTAEPTETGSANPSPETTAPTASDSPSQDDTPDSNHTEAAGRTTPQLQLAAFVQSDPIAAPTLSLPALAGPQPGTHEAVADAALTDADTSSTALALVPDQELLTDSDTVYPVLIDPSFTGHTEDWTVAYDRYPSSSFWNGQNYNDGTNEARVGYESTTGGTSRPFFRIGGTSDLKGVHVSSAVLYTYETYSWSCSGRSVQLWLTGGISASTTWNHQPSWAYQVDSLDVAHGYNSSCPDDYVKFDAKAAAQDAADSGWTNITFGLRAASETSAYAWKKFATNDERAPYLQATYNRAPNEPTSLTMTPGPDCDLSSPYFSVGKSDLTFTAKGTDPDGNLKYLQMQLWPTTGSNAGVKIVDTNYTVNSSGAVSVTVASSKFTNGVIYAWQMRSVDSSAAVSTWAPPGTVACRFLYDSSRPNSPKVTSANFPSGGDGVWSTVKFGTSGSFTFAANASTDTVKYQYSFNGGSYSSSTSVSAGASATVSGLHPPLAGPNILYARSVDAAGNVSEGAKYYFNVTPRDTLDKPGDVTGDSFPDLFVIRDTGDLRTYPGTATGDLHAGMWTANNGTSNVVDGSWDGALITHLGDYLPGDGLQDILARRDGKLWVYPGDGYGGVNVTQRREVLLPANAPAPDSFDQLVSMGNATADDKPDFLAVVGAELWAFTGYTGGTVTSASMIGSGGWDNYTIHPGDFDGDGGMDLMLRSKAGGTVKMRIGKKSGAGVDLASLGSTAASGSPAGDPQAAGGGWSSSHAPLVLSIPDVTGDSKADLWVLMDDGSVDLYAGGTTQLALQSTVISSGWDYSSYIQNFG